LLSNPLAHYSVLRPQPEALFSGWGGAAWGGDFDSKSVGNIPGKMTGTHKGPLPVPTGTVPATNKRFELMIATFERLDGDGQIVEERRYYDISGWLGQLGIAP
jgi:hypothetical protein